MRSAFTFNGQSSTDFGLNVEYFPESIHAARRGELISIPGRNGAIVREDGAFDTYRQQYQIWFRNTMNRNTYQNAREVAVWLLGASDFCRLEDTYEPQHFRLAHFAGPLNIETVLREHGRATLEFDAQPQRYLKSGETPLTFTGNSVFTIINPTQFESRPLLKFTDVTTPPSWVQKTLTMRSDYIIDAYGEIYETPDSSLLGRYRTSNPVNISGATKVEISGNGYAFLDNNGQTRSGGFVKTGGFPDGMSVSGNNQIVPSWATSIVISEEVGNARSARLYTQAPQPNPGDADITVNGVKIKLDFTEHDTIYLDCDLHDAYYADGSSANKMVSFSSTVVAYPTFPGLMPGENSVIVENGLAVNFELTPRWWTL